MCTILHAVKTESAVLVIPMLPTDASSTTINNNQEVSVLRLSNLIRTWRQPLSRVSWVRIVRSGPIACRPRGKAFYDQNPVVDETCHAP